MELCSRCAMAALGLSLVVIGVILCNRDSTWSVAVVILCAGTGFLVLSLIYKVQWTRGEPHSSDSVPSLAGEDERQREEAECYGVPSYEEVVGNDQYTIGHLSEPNYCTTDLPAYEDVMETDCGVDFSDE
ncbi:uncharacterized protein LOC143491014 [Brachyhypopomus gauderio]|uniref:uncharacterized protein LOC143491014 n=1 Tax=Brachyhypopomus gauderio TaxID=698409 RepID=UPI00404347BF